AQLRTVAAGAAPLSCRGLTLVGLCRSEDAVPHGLLGDSNGLESRQVALELRGSSGESILLQKVGENLNLDFLADCTGRVLRHRVADLGVEARERITLPV